MLLDPDRDGVSLITDYLRGQQNVAGVHILSHGSSGSLQLGDSRLDRDALEKRFAEVSAWRDSLADDGDILIYGCNVANGRWGIDFLHELAAATGGGVNGSPINLQINTTDEVAIQGLAADDVFDFQGVPHFTGNARQNPTLDGGADTDTVDFSSLDQNLAFTVNNTHQDITVHPDSLPASSKPTPSIYSYSVRSR